MLTVVGTNCKKITCDNRKKITHPGIGGWPREGGDQGTVAMISPKQASKVTRSPIRQSTAINWSSNSARFCSILLFLVRLYNVHLII